VEALARRGYTAADIEAIAGGNFRRVFAAVRAAARQVAA
jgi:microsomal dipeptidase-like Zn-dependent dipeptidase